MNNITQNSIKIDTGFFLRSLWPSLCSHCLNIIKGLLNVYFKDVSQREACDARLSTCSSPTSEELRVSNAFHQTAAHYVVATSGPNYWRLTEMGLYEYISLSGTKHVRYSSSFWEAGGAGGVKCGYRYVTGSGCCCGLKKKKKQKKTFGTHVKTLIASCTCLSGTESFSRTPFPLRSCDLEAGIGW